MTNAINHEEAGVVEAIRIVEAAGYIVRKRPRPCNSAERISHVLKRRSEGWTDEATSVELGVTRSTVSGIIWRHKTQKERATQQQESSQ